MSFNFLNNIYTLGLYFIYVTLFSSNIYMLVIYLFYATQKTLCYTKGNIFILCYTKNAIVVPDRCCSQNPTTCTCFFLVCITTWPMSSSDTVSKFKVSQWDHTSSMVGYHDLVSTASSQRDYVSSQPSVITTWQTCVGGGPDLTVAHSARQDMCQVTLYSKTYHPTSW